MMGIGGPSATDEARLLCDIFDMLSIANTTRCGQCECGFVDCRGSEMPFTARTNSGVSVYRELWVIQPRLESLLDVLSIGRRPLLSVRLLPVFPVSELVGGVVSKLKNRTAPRNRRAQFE